MVSMRDLWRKTTRAVQDQMKPHRTSSETLPCAICGAPAVTWSYRSSDRAEVQVIEGSPVCASHDQLGIRDVAG